MKSAIWIGFCIALGMIIGAVFSCYDEEIAYEQRLGYYSADGESFERYSVDPLRAQWTPMGLTYQGRIADPAEIDRVAWNVLECLHRQDAWGQFQVVIADDWEYSCDGSQQVLPVRTASFSGCAAKGQAPIAGCSCRWRAGVHGPNTIVVTPSLYLFPDALTRWATGSNDPWTDLELRPCVNPLTGPLDGVVRPHPSGVRDVEKEGGAW